MQPEERTHSQSQIDWSLVAMCATLLLAFGSLIAAV